MSPKYKVAIYSGVMPSSTFIERLIDGLSETSACEVYLFGKIQKKVSYNSNVIIAGYKNSKSSKLIELIRYTILLFLFRRTDKLKLDAILKSNNKSTHLNRLNYYSVLWHKPEIFHLQWAKDLKDWVWVKGFGIKLVLSLRGSHINYSPLGDLALTNMYKNYFPRVDAFHAVSKAIAKESQKYGSKPERIQVVYSGLNLVPQNLRHKRQNKVFEIVSVGRPHWVKGYVYAIDALKILKNKGFLFKYTIVGALNSLELKYQINELEMHNEVSLLGKTPFNTVADLIRSSDLLLLPSVEEGLANVVLEAMSLRTLVLTTNCGGMEEVVEDGINGFVCPIRDSDMMAKCITNIMKLEIQAKEHILDSAQKIIDNQHSEAHMVKGILDIYDGVLKRDIV